MKNWYISHPAKARENAPVFFSALQTFATSQSAVSIVMPPDPESELKPIRDLITAADLILVEVSTPSTGSGIELGWASAADKPIVAFHQGGAEPTPVLQTITNHIHVYVTEAHILEILDQLL